MRNIVLNGVYTGKKLFVKIVTVFLKIIIRVQLLLQFPALTPSQMSRWPAALGGDHSFLVWIRLKIWLRKKDRKKKRERKRKREREREIDRERER